MKRHLAPLLLLWPLALAALPARAQEFQIGFINRCSKPIRLAVSYRDTAGRWQDKGMWDFAPGERSLLTDIRTGNRTFYYYAESTDGSLVWGANDQPTLTVRGQVYRPLKVTASPSGDTYYQTLTCLSNSSPTPRTPAVSSSKGRYPGASCDFGGRTGTLQVFNASLYPITVSLWHPDSQRVHHTLTIPPSTSVGPSFVLGDDWGIQLGSSPVKCLGRVADQDSGGVFRVDSQSFHQR